jgi:adenosylcobinamide-GDP ribazoletransferase
VTGSRTWQAWRLSAGTLTCLPVRPPNSVDAGIARGAIVLGPFAALPLAGLVLAILSAGRELDVPLAVTGLLAVGALAAGSRALHWDGLSDTVDALTSSYDATRSLAVMRSGSAGPAGVVAVVVVLGSQALCLGALAATERGAVLAAAAIAVSRGSLALCCLSFVRPAREDGLGATFARSVPVAAAAVLWIGLAAALAVAASCAGLDWWRGVLAAALAVVVTSALLARATSRFGGVTGDVFGACVELSLLALLVTLA